MPPDAQIVEQVWAARMIVALPGAAAQELEQPWQWRPFKIRRLSQPSKTKRCSSMNTQPALLSVVGAALSAAA